MYANILMKAERAMAEMLRATVDKFHFEVAPGRLYAPDGIWVQPQAANRVRLGATDYLQQHNGDVAFVTLRPVGTLVRAGDPFAEIETMKVTIEVASPMSGTVVQVNDAVTQRPELLNQDPYGEGWLAEIEASHWPAERAQLLDTQAYLAVMQAEAERELGS
jgi:glycine cleavage system H protein